MVGGLPSHLFGQCAAMLSAFFWASSVLLFQRAKFEYPPHILCLYRNIIAAILFFITCLAIPGGLSSIVHLPMHDFLILSVSGIVGITVADTLFFFAISRMEASSFGIIQCLYSPSVILLAVAFLGESLSTPQCFGVVLVISASLFLSLGNLHGKLHVSPIGIIAAVCSVVSNAVAAVIAKPILQHTPLIPAITVRVGVGMLLLLVEMARMGSTSGFHDYRRTLQSVRRGVVCAPQSGEETRKIFVGGIIPGEEGEVSVKGQASKFLHGELVSLTKTSSARREPPCEYFGRCGGCNLQFMTIDSQREAKVDMVASMLLRQGGLVGLPPVVDVSSSLPEFSYRRRATFHLSFDGRLGFYRMGSRDVVPIQRCMIAEDAVNKKLLSLQRVSRELAPFIGCIEVDIGNGETVICKLRDGVTPFKLLHLRNIWNKLGNVQIKYKGKDLVYSHGQFLPDSNSASGHFSQVNRFGNKILVEEVLKRCTGKTATELYAGAGNFTFPLAERGFIVAAVELDPSLVSLGSRAAKGKRLEHKIAFHESSCERYVRNNSLNELVILDPPRSGALEVVKRAQWSVVQSVIYISCNLPSLARDLKILVNEQGFTVEELLLVDMFPQTHHTEIIASLKRK